MIANGEKYEHGWWEEYRCGCVSETVRYKKDLAGYCDRHGDNSRYVHPDYVPTEPPEQQP